VLSMGSTLFTIQARLPFSLLCSTRVHSLQRNISTVDCPFIACAPEFGAHLSFR
jgi:hypothetical protein